MWKRFLLKILVSSIAVTIAAELSPGVSVKNYTHAILLALALSVLNAFVKPLLILFTIPLTLFTFGLFLFVVNALIALIAASFVPGFQVDGFWNALVFSVLLSILNSIFETINRHFENANKSAED